MKMRTRTSKAILATTILLSVLLCAIIIAEVCLGFFQLKTLQAAKETLPAALIENIYNQESLTLSLVGVAISVWIGLNLYNAVTKEEMRALMDGAQATAAEAAEQVYAEMLKSKFRMSSPNTASEYFDIQLEAIGPLPMEISQKVLELEDLFQISYRLYGEGVSSKDNDKGVSLAEKLQEKAKVGEEEGLLKSTQYRFLMGYASWRWGDFLYYQARYGRKNDADRNQTARCAIEQYKKVGQYLFDIQDIAELRAAAARSPEKRSFLAYLANDIGASYIDIIGDPDRGDLTQEELAKALAVEKTAVDLSSGLPNRLREMFLRNLGIAYEKSENIEAALRNYRKAYWMNPGNWRSAHCIASLYRRKALGYFHPGSTLAALRMEKLDAIQDCQLHLLLGEDRAELMRLLKQSLYWYEVKQANFHGQAEGRLIELNAFLYRLTGDNTYRKNRRKAEESWRYMQVPTSETPEKMEQRVSS